MNPYASIDEMTEDLYHFPQDALSTTTTRRIGMKEGDVHSFRFMTPNPLSSHEAEDPMASYEQAECDKTCRKKYHARFPKIR
jgi:hypothetical protein